MCVQDSRKALHNAVAAAKQYVKLKKECRDRHEAFIGVSVNGQDKHGVKKVFVDVTDENVKIIIEDLHTLCSHNTNIFTLSAMIFQLSIIHYKSNPKIRYLVCRS